MDYTFLISDQDMRKTRRRFISNLPLAHFISPAPCFHLPCMALAGPAVYPAIAEFLVKNPDISAETHKLAYFVPIHGDESNKCSNIERN